MTKLYIVKGDSGMYGDHVDWLVCAYLDRSFAMQHAASANAQWKLWCALPREERVAKCKTEGDEWSWFSHLDPVDAFGVDGDEYKTIDGRDYTVEEVELRDALPEVP